MNNLLVNLESAKRAMLQFSDIALKQKKIDNAKKFDVFAVSIDQAIHIIKDKQDA